MTAQYALSPRNPGDHVGVARWMLLGIGGFGAIIVGEVIQRVVARIPGDSLRNPLALGDLLFGSFILALGVYGFLALGPGAVQCTWDSEGFRLHYRRGGDRIFLWGSPTLAIRLVELTGSDRTWYSIATRFPATTPVPEELYLLILDEAARRGLVVNTRSSAVPGGKRVETRIRSASSRSEFGRDEQSGSG